MKPGDKVRITTDKIPGINRPLPESEREGVVLEIPEEYEGRVVIVRLPGNKLDDWLPAGSGWTFFAEHVEPVISPHDSLATLLAEAHELDILSGYLD